MSPRFPAHPDRRPAVVTGASSGIGAVEVVVANAGSMRPGRVWEQPTAELARDLDTNLLGTHRLITRFGAAMVARGRGDLVVVSSDVVQHPRPRLGGYVAAKCGLEGLVRVLQLELEGTGVRACLVRPGPTRSGIADGWSDAAVVEVVADAERFGLLRHGNALRPEAVAAAIAHVVALPRGVTVPAVDVAPEATLAGTGALR